MELGEIKERLQRLDTASLADANKNLRVVDPTIRPVRSGLKLIGVAHTVRCHEDFLTVIKALQDSTPGEVLVIDTGNSRAAVAGELFSTEAMRKGLAGLVIDGACRDTAKLKTLDFPVYSRSIIPLSGSTSGIFETQVPVTCGSVTVNPGDIVLGDDDGVVIATIEELTELLPSAEDIQSKEEYILTQMERGMGLLEMINFAEHWKNLESGKESELKFKV